MDCSGVPLAAAGDQKSGSREYLNLGDMRLINNKWGSDELGCTGTQSKVYVNTDRTIGWQYSRPTCGGNAEKPDYPEIEFGVNPFGVGSSLATTPSCSTTTLLPKQIKDIASASITLDNYNIALGNVNVWNLNFEMWLSQQNPIGNSNPGVYAEVIVFWGWKYSDLWKCNASGSVTSSGKSYNLCHQDDAWAGGKWRYFHYNSASGSSTSFTGKFDVKPFLDYLVNTKGYSKDLWVTRFEIGTEFDDNTAATVKLNNISFEVNGTSKTVETK